MISTKDKYAINAMIDIAIYYSNNGYVTTKDISKRQNLSIKYLEQVIAHLVKANLLRSYRGANGGYGLVKKPEEYNALEIIKAVSGEINVDNEPGACSKLINGYLETITNYFESIKLSDLVLDYQTSIGAGLYYI